MTRVAGRAAAVAAAPGPEAEAGAPAAERDARPRKKIKWADTEEKGPLENVRWFLKDDEAAAAGRGDADPAQGPQFSPEGAGLADMGGYHAAARREAQREREALERSRLERLRSPETRERVEAMGPTVAWGVAPLVEVETPGLGEAPAMKPGQESRQAEELEEFSKKAPVPRSGRFAQDPSESLVVDFGNFHPDGRPVSGGRPIPLTKAPEPSEGSAPVTEPAPGVVPAANTRSRWGPPVDGGGAPNGNVEGLLSSMYGNQDLLSNLQALSQNNLPAPSGNGYGAPPVQSYGAFPGPPAGFNQGTNQGMQQPFSGPMPGQPMAGPPMQSMQPPMQPPMQQSMPGPPMQQSMQGPPMQQPMPGPPMQQPMPGPPMQPMQSAPMQSMQGAPMQSMPGPPMQPMQSMQGPPMQPMQSMQGPPMQPMQGAPMQSMPGPPMQPMQGPPMQQPMQGPPMQNFSQQPPQGAYGGGFYNSGNQPGRYNQGPYRGPPTGPY